MVVINAKLYFQHVCLEKALTETESYELLTFSSALFSSLYTNNIFLVASLW